MNNIARAFAILFGVSVLTACAVTVPKEMKLADPQNRRTVDSPGTNIDSIRLACAETMLNASPAIEATNIDVRVLSQGDIVVTEANAVLKSVGMLKEDLPVTYRCEYRNGKLASGAWTRGLK